MPSEDERIAQRLRDIVQNIDAAKRFICGCTYEEFAADDLRHYVVVRALEIISEASRHIPDDMKVRHSNIEWHKIRASGNIYRHGYEEVDVQAIWDTVRQHLDPLYAVVTAELETLRR
jgi:uncharacterized protein with HEPN domain